MGKKLTLEATAYGPPWDAMEGTGITSKGVKLKAGQQKLVVAVDPTVIPYGTKLKFKHNPFGDPNLIFTAADTGGAFQGGVNKVDFFVASGRKDQNRWGRKSIEAEIVGHGSPTDVGILGGQKTRGMKQTGSAGAKGAKSTLKLTGGNLVTDEAALAGAQRRTALAQYIAGRNPNDLLLKTGAISTTAPRIEDFQKIAKVKLTGKAGTAATGGTPAASPRAARAGRVIVAPGANRPGVDLTPGVMKVLRKISAQAGHTIHVGTGTNHNQMTTSGNVSDHWDGNASDVPASGEALTKLGQQALIAAGMPEAEARKAKGGVYNIPYGKGRRIQILFNTNVGGNHFNHLHVGVTAK